MTETIKLVSDALVPYVLYMLVGAGVLFFVRLGAVQIRDFLRAITSLFKRQRDNADGDVSPIAALTTAIGGIVGNGNIAGVATAIVSGGPGALFWMWVSGVLGMGTMYAESYLGVKYRKKGADQLYVGGPMYYMRDGLGPKWKWIAAFFAFGLAAKTMLATTTIQSNSIASAMAAQFAPADGYDAYLEKYAIYWCLLVSVLTGAAILGGIKTIGKVSEVITPFMGVIYLVASATVLVVFWRQIPSALEQVFKYAFTPMAGIGGATGITVQQAFRFGLARGVYSNEAGTGSVPIAHASAKTNNAAQQARIAMLGVFLDTLVVASATGLVLLVTGAWQGDDDSSAAVAGAFGQALGDYGTPVVTVSCLLFGLTTLISWSFYGEQCATYLFGPTVRKPYRVLYCLAILGGAAAGTKTIWAWGDLLNGIMTIPNLLAIVLLSGQVAIASRRKSDEVINALDANN